MKTKLAVFARKHHGLFKALAVASWTITLGLVLAGCAGLPVWISDATSILPLLTTMASSILTVIAALGGKVDPSVVATMNTVVSDVNAGLASVQAMVHEYNSTPSTTLLDQIKAGVKAVSDNITTYLANTGIANPSIQSKVVAIFQLVLTQLTAWASILPAVTAVAGEQITLTVPFTKDQLKTLFNSIVLLPSGDPELDAALKKVKL